MDSPQEPPTLIEPPADATLPQLPGPYAVATTARELIDYQRPDPLAPNPQPRSVVAQLWYPTVRGGRFPPAPYMSAAAGAVYDASLGFVSGTFASIQTRARADAPPLPCWQGWPVLLFSPGQGASRSLYTVLMEGLASEGFVVVALDHPYDARVVQFPDGRTLDGIPPSLPEDPTADMQGSLALRVADILFVLDQLPQLDNVLGGVLDLRRVGLFGHSLGGAATGLVMLADKRIAAGANLDGTSIESSAQQEMHRPFLLMSNASRSGRDDATWRTFRAQLKGFYRELQLMGTTHATFTDLASLSTILGVNERVPPSVLTARFGSIEGGRAADILLTYLSAFFNHTLRHWPSPLLRGAASQYPEVLFVD